MIPKSQGGFDSLPADLTQQLGLGGGLPARRAAVVAARPLRGAPVGHARSSA